ncbi:MAG: hypothetical protein JWN04_5535 [Myxococcaceae bacterium]|nr:hypothetical protein [Myxococcaceae bacterium]
MRQRGRAGFTLLEIMIAVVIMTIGAAGILAMQGASVRSNQDANETSTAINFATTWMERFKRDARLWTAVGSAPLASTQYLSNALTVPPAWVVPAAVAPESAGADYFGFDTPIATGDVRYCVNARFTQAHLFNGNLDAIRVDVLVWWHRSSFNDSTRASATCATALTAAQIASVGAQDRQIRKHFLSEVVTWRDPTVWP